MLQKICQISFDEQILKDDLVNYTYANNLDQSIAQYVANGEGFALSTLNLWSRNGAYFLIDITSEFFHQIENNDYFEISFDVFFTNVTDYNKGICYFQVVDSTSMRSVHFNTQVYLEVAEYQQAQRLYVVANQWYTMKIVVDNKNNNVSVYQDDVLIASVNDTYHFVPTIVSVGDINVNRVYNYAYVDNILIKTEIQLLPPTIEIIQNDNRLNTVVTVDERLTDKTVQYEWNNGATSEYIDITESGIYTCTVTDSAGNSTTKSIDAEYVKPKEFDLMHYLPIYWHPNLEMIQIQKKSLNYLVYNLNDKSNIITTDAYINTANNSRLSEWEWDLEIEKADDIETRRENILAFFHGKGKLNEEKIKSIVYFYYGTNCDVSIKDSNIHILIYPLNENDIDYSKVERDLYKKKPAHLGIWCDRYYYTWGEVKVDYNNWGDMLSQRETWGKLKNYLPYLNN